jgi:hypothetical protein
LFAHEITSPTSACWVAGENTTFGLIELMRLMLIFRVGIAHSLRRQAGALCSSLLREIARRRP